MYYWTPGSLSQQLGIMRNALKENTPASLEFNYLLNFNWCGFTAFQSKVPGMLREVWSWLGTPGQTQPKVVFLDTIFLLPIPLYKKSLRHCFPPELLMIKESCNLIGREYLLVINLLVYVMHNKIIFFPQRSFNLSCWTFSIVTYHPQTKKATPGNTRSVCAWLDTYDQIW